MNQEITTMRRMGASTRAASFIAASMSQGRLFRVRYGHIDERNLSSLENSDTLESTDDLQKALDAYNSLAWLRTREAGNRRFVLIECSSDGGKTWPTKLFHDCQR